MASKKRSSATPAEPNEDIGATSGQNVGDGESPAPKRQASGTERRSPGRSRAAPPTTKRGAAAGNTTRSPKAAKRKAVGAAKQKDRKSSSTTTGLSGADLHGRSKGGASKKGRKGTTAGAKKPTRSKPARRRM